MRRIFFHNNENVVNQKIHPGNSSKKVHLKCHKLPTESKAVFQANIACLLPTIKKLGKGVE